MAGEQIYLYEEGRIVYACGGMQTELHKHFAAEILLSPGSSFTLRTADGDQEYGAAMIAPNTEHELLAGDSPLLVFMVDPDGEEFRFFSDDANYREKIRALDPNDFAPLSGSLNDVMEGRASCRDAYALLNEVLLHCADLSAPKREWDERIPKVLEMIKATEDLGEVSVYELAEAVGVSDNRLMHLFKQHMGLPLRRYLLWLKLRRVAMMIQDGVNVTEAAYSAGFSDAAHLSRTFKEMFGVPPTFFLNNVAFTGIHLCES